MGGFLGSGLFFGSFDGQGMLWSENPDLPFLAFLDFLAFFKTRNFLAFSSVLPFFPRDFRVQHREKNPCFFGWFSLRFPKKQGKEDQGRSCKIPRKNPAKFPPTFPAKKFTDETLQERRENEVSCVLT